MATASHRAKLFYVFRKCMVGDMDPSALGPRDFRKKLSANGCYALNR